MTTTSGEKLEVSVDVCCLQKIDNKFAVKVNAGRNAHGRRFDNFVKLFSWYVFLLSGRALSEILFANMKQLPSTKTLCRTISDAATREIEGKFRFVELKQHLVERGLPLVV